MKLHPYCWIAATACALCCAGGCATFSGHAVDSNVVDGRQQCQQGLEAARSGNSEEAETLFAAAVESCEADERARKLYAESLWSKGDREAAIKHMGEAVRLSGGDPETAVRLGEMYLAEGNVRAATRQASRAIAASPQLATAWALEGDILAASGEDDLALARYHRALAHQQRFPHVQFAVADIYAKKGRHARALATLAALSHQYEPGHCPQRLHVMRARTYRAMRQYDEAAAEFSLATRAAPPTCELLYELAETLAANGETTAARMTAEQALALEPQHADSRRLMAQLNAGGNSALRRY